MKALQILTQLAASKPQLKTLVCRMILTFLSFTCFHTKGQAITESIPNQYRYAMHQQNSTTGFNPSDVKNVLHKLQKSKKTKLISRTIKAFQAEPTGTQILLVLLTIAGMLFVGYIIWGIAVLLSVTSSGALFTFELAFHGFSTFSYFVLFVGFLWDLLLGQSIIRKILQPKTDTAG